MRVRSGIGGREPLDFEACDDCLCSTPGCLDMSVQFSDVVLQPFDPTFLLGKTLSAFFLAAIDELHDFISQLLILHIAHIGEGGADGRDDGRGK